jgi:hypothetical protein
VSPADGDPQLLYLEPDDEITSVVRRLRGADVGRVVLVAPGRSRATSSVVALRLLVRAAADTGRSVALVADASTRALAGEAGIAAFASVADATSGTPSPAEPMTPTRAPIHVVRGAAAGRVKAMPRPPVTNGLDETVAVHLPPSVGAGGRRRRLPGVPAWPWLAVLVIPTLAIGAALLPGATVRITPATVPVGPVSIPVSLGIGGHLADELQATKQGTPTGKRLEEVPATGVVTFFNFNSFDVSVPQGTHVSVGGTTAFVTMERVKVPRRRNLGGESGQQSVAVTAIEPGPDGNVAARAIDTIDDGSVRFLLRAFDDNSSRLVVNDEATTGGLETTHTVIQQTDIDAAVAAIEADLQQQLTEALAREPDRIYAKAPDAEMPEVEIPPELLGTEDTPSFELTGTLAFDRAYASRADAEAAARTAFLTLGGVVPAGTEIVLDTIVVDPGAATVSGSELQLEASVTASAAVAYDEAAVRNRIAGLTIEEARAELASLGEIEVDLWPAWVDRLPRLTFRITIERVVGLPAESAGESSRP